MCAYQVTNKSRGCLLSKAVEQKIAEAVQQIVEEEARIAADRAHERVRAMAGQIAAQVANFVDYKRLEDRLVITLRVDERQGV